MHIATPSNLIAVTVLPPIQHSPPPSLAPSLSLTPQAFKNRKGLGLLHLNVRSVLAKERLDHLRILVTQTVPDILVLSETWLKKTDSDSDVSLNYLNPLLLSS